MAVIYNDKWLIKTFKFIQINPNCIGELLTPLILQLLLKTSLQISAGHGTHMMTRTTGRTSTDYWIRSTVRLYVVVIAKMSLSWNLRSSTKTIHVYWHIEL